jgi:hypothetical protein
MKLNLANSTFAFAARNTEFILAVGALAMASSLAMADDRPAVQMPQATFGAIIGIVTNATKSPVPRATVTAVRADGSGFRAMLSGTDGSYAFSDLAPGKWSITSHAEGYPDAAAQQLEVDASKATRYDIVVNAPVMAQAPAPASSAPTPAPGAAPTPVPRVPLALQEPVPVEGVDLQTPFAYGDFTWLNGSSRTHSPIFDTNFFTPEFRMDSYFAYSFNNPKDHTISGSTEMFRSGEIQIEQISFGGDFHYDNVRARLLTMNGLFATTTPRNDASSGNIGGVGQWDLQDAYRYVSEANAGYHFDVDHGLNVDLGIFVSYIGLFSYYNFDNWAYQPSYVSSNTPWFFDGLRVQYFPTNTLKIEPWLINGWQSYGRYNSTPGFGGQILWMPNENFKMVLNNYTLGEDNLYNAPTANYGSFNYGKAKRYHTDDSIEVKYYQNDKAGPGGISKAAFSLTVDAGCQVGGGLSCFGGSNSTKSNFVGAMIYNRIWFDNDKYALTVGGGAMSNPSLYLTLLPPINGATASTGTPYFPEGPGLNAHQWDGTVTFQYMPKEWITWWAELGYRHSNIPYFNGAGGITPPGGNNGSPANYACMSGASAGTNVLSAAQSACGGGGSSVWFPDLWTHQATIGMGVLVKF